MDTIVDLVKVSKNYVDGNYKKEVLKNINIQIKTGSFVTIMGSSGSGKTTLLNIISTIDTVSNGNVMINNQEITSLSKAQLAKFRADNIGFIFQDYNLLNTLTIRENIELPLIMKKENKSVIRNKVSEIADLLHITEILDEFPTHVSGGQRQRCACARAMITGSRLILADEPTGALDSGSSKILMDMLKKMNRDYGISILMVTHDAYAASYADRILFLKDGSITTEINDAKMNQLDKMNEVMKVMFSMTGENICM